MDSPEELAKIKRFARDPLTGKGTTVPGNMSYQEWSKRHVEGNAQAEANRKRERNRSADRKQYDRFREMLGARVPKTFAEFQAVKYNNAELWKLLKIDYSRRAYLKQHPEAALPGAESVVLPEGKFTKYLFGGENAAGLAKGKGITSRLGYDISNWEKFRDSIAELACKYPATAKGDNGFGSLYEQKIILYGLTDKPANLIVAWIVRNDGATSLTSVYLKELKK